MLRRLGIGILALAAVAGSTPSRATTRYINAAGTGDYATIQLAVNASSLGDTVLLAAGTYTGVGNRDVDFGSRNIVVTSESGPAVTIIDCQGLGRGFYFDNYENAGAVVDGLTITNGVGEEGGAIFIYYAYPSITNCIMDNNSATYAGGAVYYRHNTLVGSRPVVNGNTFTANDSPSGGALYLISDNPIVENNTFDGNTTSDRGAAVYATRADFNNNIVTGNTATNRGGGIYFSSISYGSADGNIIAGNDAGIAGGGITAASTDVVVTNTLIYNNTAALLGDGIYCWLGGTPSFVNCTISDNGAAGSGNVVMTGANPTFEKCIISFGVAGPGVQCFSGANPTFICCDVYGNAGGDAICGTDGGNNFSADPIFCSSLTADYTLHSFSPCLPTASPCSLLVGAEGEGCVPVDAGDTPSAANVSVYPNPFSTSTTITVSTETPGQVDIAIYDVTGRLVRRVHSGYAEAGFVTARWYGKTPDGIRVPSGVYFVRAMSPGFVGRARVVVLR